MRPKMRGTPKPGAPAPIVVVTEKIVGWMVICSYCGNEFHAKRSDADTCSATCRVYKRRPPKGGLSR